MKNSEKLSVSQRPEIEVDDLWTACGSESKSTEKTPILVIKSRGLKCPVRKSSQAPLATNKLPTQAACSRTSQRRLEFRLHVIKPLPQYRVFFYPLVESPAGMEHGRMLTLKELTQPGEGRGAQFAAKPHRTLSG